MARVESDMDLEALARQELLNLKRQYRALEEDRNYYTKQSGTTTTRQQRTIRHLTEEKTDLITDLANALSPQHQEVDRGTTRHILNILEQYTNYQTEIDHLIEQIQEMEAQVDRITRRVIQQKLKLQAIFGHSMTIGQADRRKRNLENRLYHVTTLCDSQVSRNKVIREEIDNNLMERARFHYRSEANKKKLARMKRQMGDLVDVTTNTYDAREEAVAKIRALRERNDKESKQHVLEMKEFQRILHHDEKGHAFLMTKARHRPLLEEEVERQQRLDHAKEKQLDDLLTAYRISFRDILIFANTQNVEELVQKYQNQEQENFTKFRHISDLNNEIESIQDTIKVLKTEIETKCLAQKQRRAEQENALIAMDGEFKTALNELADLVAKWEHTEANMGKVLMAIEDVYESAKCGNASIVRLLGNQSGITPRNAELCMNVLEHRITEMQFEKSILELRRFVEIDGGQLPSKLLNIQGLKRQPTGGPFKPKVIITGQLDTTADDEEEAEDRLHEAAPIPYDEMRAILLTKFLNANAEMVGGHGHDPSRDSILSMVDSDANLKSASIIPPPM